MFCYFFLNIFFFPVDNMGHRIDDLEQSINDLMQYENIYIDKTIRGTL